MFEKLFTDFPRVAFLLLLGIVTLLFGYVLKPFFFAIFWAVLLSAVFAPLNGWLRRKIANRNLSAGLTLMAVLIMLILPVGFVLTLLVGETIDLYQSINSNGKAWMDTLTGIFNSVISHPLLARFNLDQQWMTDKSVEFLKTATEFLFKNLSALTQNTLLFLVQFAVMIYCLFYFMRDGERLMDTVARYVPVDEQHIRTLISEFVLTSKATLKVTFVIGGIQGFLGGVIFYVTGIERALVWGVLMIGCSIIPALGSAIIWAPAGIIMLLLGHIWQGVTILVFGAFVISMVDNLLRPILLGNDIQMHPLLIFLSTLGGIAVFGFSGFVLGPVIAAFFLAIWKLWPELYQPGNLEGPAAKD